MLRYLFIHTCNALSKNGTLRTRESTWFSAFTLILAGTFSWLFVFIGLFYHYILGSQFPEIPGGVIIFFIAYIPFYYAYIKNGKYKAILKESEDQSPEESKRGKLITALYLFVPMLLVIPVGLIINNKI